MTEEFFMVVPAMLGIFACIAYNIIICIWIRNSKKNFIEKAKKKDCVVEARYVKRSILAGRNDCGASDQFDRAAVTYEYFVKGKRYTKKYLYNSEGSSVVNYPTRLTLYYKKNNPRKAITANESTDGKQTLRIISSIAVLGITIKLSMFTIELLFNVQF